MKLFGTLIYDDWNNPVIDAVSDDPKKLNTYYTTGSEPYIYEHQKSIYTIESTDSIYMDINDWELYQQGHYEISNKYLKKH